MRINYYKFPEGTDENILLENGCAIICKDGRTVYADNIPDEHRAEVDYIAREISGITVTFAKELLKTFGGSAITRHFDRDGGLFETTEIRVNKNNSTHKYNRHL